LLAFLEIWEMKRAVYEQTKDMSIVEFSKFISKSVDEIIRNNKFIKIPNEDGSYRIKKAKS
jgi:hypothetical protein